MKNYYTMADLPELAHLHPWARLGVVGNPIAHSISPPMQQAALDADHRSITYVRLQCELKEGAFRQMISCLQDCGFLGVNVTVPFKKQAYAMADKADELSRLCEASNTMVFKQGRILCHNTDGPGFERAIRELCNKKLHELSVLILGACGGAGSALAAQCVLAGCRQLTLANRPRPELDSLAHKLHSHAKCTQVHTAIFGSSSLKKAVYHADLIVNATSLGLKEEDAMPLKPSWLHAHHIVYDIVTHDTPLCRAAKERGCVAATGQSMLLWQGALAFQHWFGSMPDVHIMRHALMAASV